MPQHEFIEVLCPGQMFILGMRRPAQDAEKRRGSVRRCRYHQLAPHKLLIPGGQEALQRRIAHWT